MSSESSLVTFLIELSIVTLSESGVWEIVNESTIEFEITIDVSGLSSSQVQQRIAEELAAQAGTIELTALLGHFSIYATMVNLQAEPLSSAEEPDAGALEPEVDAAVTEPGSKSSSGCAVGTSGDAGSNWMLLLLALAFAQRTRRRS